MGPIRRLHQLGLGRPRLRQAVDWEIEHYLEERAEQLVSEGWSPAEARREAERRFGRLERQRRRIVATDRRSRMRRRGAGWWDFVRSSWTQALRGVRRSPGLAAAVVITLALGIGANTTMFSIVDRLLLSPPEHVVDPDRVRRILVHGTLFGTPGTLAALTYADVVDLRTVPEFSSVGAFSSTRRFTLGEGEGADRIRAVLATSDLFMTLGVQARIGRFFASDEDRAGAPGTVVLSSELWERSFGSDPSILGRTLQIDGRSHQVVGVAPPGFTGANTSPVDVWLPALSTNYDLRGGNDRFLTSRGSYWLQAVVRIPESSSAEAAAERATALHLAARQDRIERGRFDPETYVLTAPLIAARGPTASAESRVARWLAGVSLILLLVACANVTNLLLARGSRRSREVAVRLSLGVSRSRLTAEVFSEAVLLAAAGGVLALAVAAWGGSAIRALLIPDVQWSGLGLDGRVLVATALLSAGAAILAGIAPALQSTRVRVSHALADGVRGGTRRRGRIGDILTMVQAGLSVVLLVGAGLFVRSLDEVRSLDLGLDPDRLLLATLEFRGARPDTAERNRLYLEAMERVSRLPGVARAAATDVPFGSLTVVELRLPGADSLPIPDGVGPVFYGVTPGYLRTLGIEVLSGRGIVETDVDGAPRVAVVNETMARSLWPSQDALGQCFYFDGGEECTTVVGVAEDASTGSLEGTRYLAYYLPLAQISTVAEGLYVRSEGQADELLASLGPLLRSFSPMVRYADVQTVREILDPQARSWMLGAGLFTAFGVLALVVAALGLHSLLAFDVAKRTREIGIRTALGARSLDVLRVTMAQGVRMAVFGCVAGVVIALLAAPYVEPLLFHVRGRDPLVLTSVVAVLISVACLASLAPAIVAARVHPMEALRVD